MELKNKNDIKQIKKAIQIGVGSLLYIRNFIEENITTKELNDRIENYIKKHDAIPSFKNYRGFPESTCISINEEIIHGIPSKRKLKNGDVVKIDVGVNYNEYYSDQARTYIVRKAQSRLHKYLIKKTELALSQAIKMAKEGKMLSDISKTIENTANSFGLGILENYSGHGVGFAVHEEPLIPNIYIKNDIILKKGMVLAIEPMFVLGTGKYKIGKDNWTVIADGIGAHFEETVIII